MRIAITSVLAVLISGYALAQSERATISGIITDPQGAAIIGVRVTVRHEATGISTSTSTNEAGLYSLPNLPVGPYSLDAEHEGFPRYSRPRISLTTGEVLALDIQLQLGQTTETLTITGEAPLVESRTSEIGQLMDSKSIADLPLGNRRAMNVVQLTGAATFVNETNFSLAGGRTGTQMWFLDGGSEQNMRLGVGSLDTDFPIETIQEIRVISNNYSAEYGATAGGVVIMTSKSGTNRFRGSLYEFLRNNILDAPGFFAPVQSGSKVQPELRYNVFGGTVGGPIRHNKTFFFIGYEAQAQRTGSTSTLTVPTALQQTGDFSQTLTAAGKLIPIYDPASTELVNGAYTRLQFPGNAIPSSRLDPVALRILNYYPQPNRAPDNISGANNFRANYAVGQNTDFYYGKLDHSFSERDRFSGRYNYTTIDGKNTTVFPNNGASDPTAYSIANQHWGSGDWNHIVKPTLINEVRFTYTTRLFHSLTRGVGGDYPAKLGLTGVSENAFPQIAPAGFSSLGSAGQDRRQWPVDYYQFVDNLAWVKGRHSFKFGAELRHSHDHEVNLSTASGSFTFATTATGLPGNAATGSGLASMLVGFPTGFSSNETAVTDRTSWYVAAFAQDQLSITRTLVLNLGVRWEVDTPMIDTNNRMNGFDGSSINPVSGTPGVVKFMGVNGFPVSAYRIDLNNFGPRFGFAWKPFHTENTVVRGGYGIFYSHPFDAGQPASAQLGFSQSIALNTPDNGITAPFHLASGVPAVNTSTQLNDSFGAVPVGQQASTAVTYFDPSRRTGYSQQFNLGFQQQLSGSMVLEVSGLGNLGHKLPNTNLPIDQILPQILGPSHQSQQDRPFPQFNGVTILSPTLGDSRYLAGLIKLEKRFSHGLNLVSTYTYSQFLDNTFEGAAQLGADNGPYSNYYNRRADWGPSANDLRHRFTFSTVYELPFGKTKRWLSQGPLAALAGGWLLGNVTTVQSGPPFTVVTQTNTSNAFSAGSLRANVVGDPNAGVQRNVFQWFNTAAFAQPAIYNFGNEGNGALRAPGLIGFDLSILRNIRVRDRIALQFRGEFINALNHTNLGVPATSFGAAGFGVINSAGNARQVQLGLRLEF